MLICFITHSGNFLSHFCSLSKQPQPVSTISQSVKVVWPRNISNTHWCVKLLRIIPCGWPVVCSTRSCRGCPLQNVHVFLQQFYRPALSTCWYTECFKYKYINRCIKYITCLFISKSSWIHCDFPTPKVSG